MSQSTPKSAAAAARVEHKQSKWKEEDFVEVQFTPPTQTGIKQRQVANGIFTVLGLFSIFWSEEIWNHLVKTTNAKYKEKTRTANSEDNDGDGCDGSGVDDNSGNADKSDGSDDDNDDDSNGSGAAGGSDDTSDESDNDDDNYESDEHEDVMDTKGHDLQWKDVTVDEMKIFMALWSAMGVIKQPEWRYAVFLSLITTSDTSKGPLATTNNFSWSVWN